jgi:predicted site-specific integrase-resolvase
MYMQAESPKLLTRKQAAEFLAIAPQTLALWASTGRYQLPFIRVGRAARYRMSDLENFLTSRSVNGQEQ